MSRTSKEADHVSNVRWLLRGQENNSGGFLDARVLHNTRDVQWEFSMNEVSNPKTAAYNMIIGTDILYELALDLSMT